jgi:hypothetical protein
MSSFEVLHPHSLNPIHFTSYEQQNTNTLKTLVHWLCFHQTPKSLSQMGRGPFSIQCTHTRGTLRAALKTHS